MSEQSRSWETLEMTTLHQASRQWASRPADERFTSLHALHNHTVTARANSAQKVVSTRQITMQPATNDEIKGVEIVGPNGAAYNPTHWSFGQLAGLAGAPAGYLRALPAPIAADALNYGLRFARDIDDVGVLLRRNGSNELAAATGPRYGRVWNSEITSQLVERFGDSVTGDWRVPGEFGHAIDVNKANTTLYASDRDMFIFLADETNRVKLPNRRNGQSGSLARGFFIWNSEVGATTFGIAMFLFDYVCCNRIVWGAEGFKELKFRHTISAPDRFLEEIVPVLSDLRESSPKPIEETLLAAQSKRVDDMAEFLANRRFGKGVIAKITEAFEADENRAPETIWDAATAITAYARSVSFQDERVALEREACKLLDLVAV